MTYNKKPTLVVSHSNNRSFTKFCTNLYIRHEMTYNKKPTLVVSHFNNRSCSTFCTNFSVRHEITYNKTTIFGSRSFQQVNHRHLHKHLRQTRNDINKKPSLVVNQSNVTSIAAVGHSNNRSIAAICTNISVRHMFVLEQTKRNENKYSQTIKYMTKKNSMLISLKQNRQ